MPDRAFRIGVDVGGTFTKAALIDHATCTLVSHASVHTTHDHPHGVAAGVIAAFQAVLRSASVMPAEVVYLAHSTTQATNALLEGDVAHVGIIGLADERAAKLGREHVHIEPIELAPGRFLRTGNRFLPTAGLEAGMISEVIASLRADGAQVLVASAAFGPDDPHHEQWVREIGVASGLPTTCGHDVTTMYGLRTRTRTATINASVLPKMISTADMTESSIKASGISAPLMIMRGDGGVMDIHEVRRRPILTLLSGPAASVAGALMHVRMSDGIYFEVGGTSTNVGVVRGGRPATAYAEIGGHSTYLNSIDVRVLGVAGGSLIQVEDGRIADVGPRSAHIAGLPYACFADPTEVADADVEFFSPKEGEKGVYVAVRSARGRYALTTTCASNALGLTTPDMHCHAPPAAARAAFAPLAAYLRTGVDAAAAAVLGHAAGKIRPVIEGLISQYRLDPDQKVLIGEGGGAGALLPFVADGMGLRYEIPRHAEIISAIGVALAMVREVVERVCPDPSPEDIAAVRQEALDAIIRLGADRSTVDVAVEADRITGKVRAVAMGAAALSVPNETPVMAEADARQLATASFGVAGDTVELLGATTGMFVYGVRQADGLSIRVIDQYGNVRVQRSNARVRSTVKPEWKTLIADTGRARNSADAGPGFSGAMLVYGKHLLDLTGIGDLTQALAIAEPELEILEKDEAIMVLDFPRSFRPDAGEHREELSDAGI